MKTRFQNKKLVWWIVLIAAAIAFVGAAAVVAWHFIPFGKNTDFSAYKTGNGEIFGPAVELVDNPIDFTALHQCNTDICGWINVPGTNIDYPILQSGNDVEENFYLKHDPDKKELFDGSIYIQKANNKQFKDPNTVIYGHNLYNGLMFTQLRKFRNAEFFAQNQTMYIYTPNHILTYQIFAALVYDDRLILNAFDFTREDEYQSFLKQMLKPASSVANVREGAVVTTKDRIITLSTCTNKFHERYLVEGVLINDQLTR